MNRSNLLKRLLFAAWAIPLGWLAINVTIPVVPRFLTSRIFSIPQTEIYPGHMLAILLVFLGAAEYLRMLSLSFPKNGFWLVYFWLAFQMCSYFEPLLSFSTRLDSFILFMMVAFEAVVWGKKSARWRRASLLFSGTAFLSIAGFAMLSFYANPFQAIFRSRFPHLLLSQMGIVTICAAIFCCDSAAYFIGSLFGRHHFSSISPRKTIEGSIAGLITAIVVTTVGWMMFFTAQSRNKYSLVFGIVLGCIIGIFAQLGDMVVSLMKRYFRVKDASNLIPGHGGVLDRFDSVFFAAPVIQLFLTIIARIVPP
jgi:phosphatidate cytidylyltransferase